MTRKKAPAWRGRLEALEAEYAKNSPALADPGRRPAAVREQDAAAYLQVTVAFLRGKRAGRGREPGPPFVRYGRRAVRYLVADLDRWVESRRVLTKAGR